MEVILSAFRHAYLAINTTEIKEGLGTQ